MRDEAWFRQRAKELYHEEGEIEVDDGASVSIGEDAGAYVQAWVWVDSEEDGGTDDVTQSVEKKNAIAAP
jgi:hypothetical protein